MAVTVEISECRGANNRICVRFPYSENLVRAVRTIPGRTYVKTGKHWHVPLDMEVCRRLREEFGRDLNIGPNLWSWAKEQGRLETSLGSLALADSADLKLLPGLLPGLYEAIHVGPIGLTMTAAQRSKAMTEPGSYQTADVRYLADSPAPLNGNEQGTGKTPEWIAAVWESGLAKGDHLVVCTQVAIEGTWGPELDKWQQDAPCEVGIFECTGNRAQREQIIQEFLESTAEVKWLLVNPEMVRYTKDPNGSVTYRVTGKKALTACVCSAMKDPHEHYSASYPLLHNHVWTTVAVDECHKNSIRNHRSITSKSMTDLKYSGKLCAMSGTPMKKKGADIWGILNWLRPEVFTSYWRFAGDYFEIEENGYGKKVHGLLKEREDAFFRMLTPYMLRRLKSEVLPWLPPKHHVDVPCRMGERQQALYNRMHSEGVARLVGGEVSTTNVLAEFTRLGQFATAVCEVKDGEVWPTRESCKFDALFDKMDEAGMFDEGATKKQVVFSQSRKVIDLVAEMLAERGLKVDVIKGGQAKRGQRGAIRKAFQEGDTRVLCIVTEAGGVSLTLDMADEAHFLDESWAPDDTMQAEDRIHRASRVHNVTIFHYRTEDSIDDYRKEMALEKKAAHEYILDVRRTLIANPHVPAPVPSR